MLILCLAIEIPNHSALSTSGKCCRRPDFGGHSSPKVLDLKEERSGLALSAQAKIVLPLFIFTGGKGKKLPSTIILVSSASSRRAADSGSSGSSNSPLGMDQTPSSFLVKNGPPGCTSNTSRLLSEYLYSNMPALFFAISL